MVRLFEDTYIQAIADAIRGKNGTTDKYKTSEMADAITSIQTGGDIDALIDRSITEISSNATTIGASAFEGCKSLTTADFPFATSIGNAAFSDCQKLTTVNFPLAESIGTTAFFNCDVLKSAVFPNVTTISSSAFSSCDELESVDFHSQVSIGTYAFRYGFNLKALILRSNAVCPLASVVVFSQCYHMTGTENSSYNPDGLQDGFVYVPSALISEYQSAATWSSCSVAYRALEDYTVDGTITGALDESKI